MNDKKLWKNKYQIRNKDKAMYLLPNLSQFGELQFFGPNLSNKHFRLEY